MRAAVYARVSSAKQRDTHTIESQLRVLPDFVRARGWVLAVAAYVDDGRSAKAGKLEARTGLAALLRDAAAGLFDVVVVVDIDRLTRSEDLVERGAILGGLQRAGVKVAIAATGQVLDFSDSTGDLYGSLQAFFAAEWARKHRSRIVEGKLTAISRGKKPAGPTPYGYRYDRATGAWSINEPEAAVVREVFARGATETAYAIALDLAGRAVPAPRGGGWTAQKVYRVLAQRAYRGEWIADKRRGLTIPIPRIIEDAAWYALRDRGPAKARQLAALRKTRHDYLCEGIATCAVCGSRIGIATASKSRSRTATPSRYVCPMRRDPKRHDIDGERCSGPYWKVAEVDGRVWAAIERLVLESDAIERVSRRAQLEATEDAETWRTDLAAAEKRLARLARVEAGILKRYRAELVTEDAFDAELAAIGRERVQAQQQADAARGAQFAAGRRVSRSEALEARVADLRQAIAAATPADRAEIVRALVPAGGVRLGLDTIDLDVDLAAAPRSTSQVALVVDSGSSCGDESSMRFRLVA